MDLFDCIITRRSVRQFTGKPVAGGDVRRIIEAGTWAPSGLNNQPWRFVVIRARDARVRLAALTKYGRIIEAADVCIAVFSDRESMYHDIKDAQSCGACIQNMLLAAHAMGLGAVWLGEILRSSPAARSLCGMADQHELMAVIALGHPEPRERTSSRRPLDEVILKEI